MQIHDHGDANLWTPAYMARQIKSSQAIECCKIVVEP